MEEYIAKEKAIELHREMWDWLAKNPCCEKCDWLGWKRNGGLYDEDAIINHCWLCHYVKLMHGRLNCKKCPLLWPKPYNCEEGLGGHLGLYLKWQNTNDDKESSKIAGQIRDLKVRK